MKKIAKYGVICLIIVIALMLIILGINLYVKSSRTELKSRFFLTSFVAMFSK